MSRLFAPTKLRPIRTRGTYRDPRPARIFVLSDGHVGAYYSRGSEAWRKIFEEGMRGYWIMKNRQKTWVDHPAKIYIDGGDNREVNDHIVKYDRHHTLFTLSRVINNHICSLERDVKAYPNCKFVMIKDNHTRVPEFDLALAELGEQYPKQMSIHTFFTRVADALVEHGDFACRPKESFIDEARAEIFDGTDFARYGHSYKTLSQSLCYQAAHDVISKYMTSPIVWLFCRPEIHVSKIVNRFLQYDACHAGQDSVLEQVNHIISMDTHQSHVAHHHEMIDPQTGERKTLIFSNPGANIRGCANPLSLFLNTDDPDDPHAKITDIISLTRPQRRWSSSPSGARVPARELVVA
jgi:hypothetical protein